MASKPPATHSTGALPPHAQLLHQQRFSVSYEYPVVFCDEVISKLSDELAWAITRDQPARAPGVVFCVDDGLMDHWPDLPNQCRRYCEKHGLSLREPVLFVPGGEACKNDPGVVSTLLGHLARAKLDRHSCVVALGGGAVLDAVGYAAALVHRGIRLVRMPTTVLAQNDAGIGVKNGVNAFGSKNFLGTFAPPFAVLNDTSWLSTLPARDLRAGLAEAVKVAVIRNSAFFDWLEANAASVQQPGPTLNEAVRWCARLHLDHIATSGDPFEAGSARPLDYGHWAAHKLELLSDHELRHGEAVSIGMLLDARYAEQVGRASTQTRERLHNLLLALGLPIFHPALVQAGAQGYAVLAGLDEFREHLGGQLTVTLLQDVGSAVEVNELDQTEIAKAIDWLAAMAVEP
jgi:3-dehydroquinate synthase